MFEIVFERIFGINQLLVARDCHHAIKMIVAKNIEDFLVGVDPSTFRGSLAIQNRVLMFARISSNIRSSLIGCEIYNTENSDTAISMKNTSIDLKPFSCRGHGNSNEDRLLQTGNSQNICLWQGYRNISDPQIFHLPLSSYLPCRKNNQGLPSIKSSRRTTCSTNFLSSNQPSCTEGLLLSPDQR